MFGNTTIGILLLSTHILACITVGIIFRFWNSKNEIKKSTKNNNKNNQETVHISNLGKILAESITNSIQTILMIGGFVVIFSSIISILKSSGLLILASQIIRPIFNITHISSSFSIPFLTGIFEITNGIQLISQIPEKAISINIIFTAFLLGFGGISVFLQVFSIISKTDLSIKPYLYGKLLHGLIAAFYTFIAIQIFPFLNFDLL